MALKVVYNLVKGSALHITKESWEVHVEAFIKGIPASPGQGMNPESMIMSKQFYNARRRPMTEEEEIQRLMIHYSRQWREDSRSGPERIGDILRRNPIIRKIREESSVFAETEVGT